jgi:ribosomal protein S27AE
VSRVPAHVFRLVGVFAVFLGGTLAVRAFVIPKSFKDRSLHRNSTMQREAAKTVRYANTQACKECHDDEYAAKEKSFHRNLSCGTCHGPLQSHTEDPMKNPAKAPRDRSFCLTCHGYDAARPTGFPQINPVLHNPVRPCFECHNPHDPTPKETPHECSACHAQIFNTKSVSPHALLECTTCHETPEQHRLTPRLVKPSKPTERSFCGKCHSKDAERKDTPKIDLASHEERYLCWQCHYPHMPEAR